MSNKERMLHMVLDEDLYQALNSENVIVAAVARIIKYLDGSTDESDQKKVYMTVFNYINENYIL